LKGALLFDLWFDVPHRPTRDADFLGFGPTDQQSLREALAKVCRVASEDGITFDANSITIEEIREDARYGGLRARLVGRLGNARCQVQLDIGYGDAVTPGPEEILYPTMLEGLPAPRLRAYPRVTVAAEKMEAMVSLGIANSRMKDYFDLRALARECAIDPEQLAAALAATFKRRGTLLPDGVPFGLSEEFAADPTKIAQWRAFLGRNRLDAPPLIEVVTELRDFLATPLRLARE
jgi:hypothetical protein